MPTAANLNLYRGCDEPLFGEYGDAKLIVSLSFGSSAVFKWKGQSCPDDEGHLCWPDHGDILVMDADAGQVSSLYGSWSGTKTDERYVPLDQITCSLLSFVEGKSGMLFANVCAGFISSCYGECGKSVFFVFFWDSPWCLLCIWEVLAFLFYTPFCTGRGSRRCASCWTRPLGGGRWWHYLCDLWGECLTAYKTAKYFYGIRSSSMWRMPYMLALVGQLSLHGYDASMVHWVKGALRRICRQNTCKTLFLQKRVLLFSRKSLEKVLGSGVLALVDREGQESWTCLPTNCC